LPGQAAYACATAWLDALVAWRTAWGLPGTAINWGQWADVGIGRSLTLSALDPVTPAEGIEALESLVGGDLTRVGVARLRLDRAAAASPEIRELGYFAGLVEELDVVSIDDRPTLDDPSVGSLRDWSQMSPENVCREFEIGVRAILARELGMPASAVDMDRPFPELGLDSMMAMTVLRDAKQFVGIELSATMLWDHPTIASLAGFLAEMLAPQKEEPQINEPDEAHDSEISVLDALFDSVESAVAGSESGIR
jgi:phthiocerol/phenolphthiocerol synthesis type-I polyketide synthase D